MEVVEPGPVRPILFPKFSNDDTYKVTMVVLDKLSIQGRYGCYMGPE